MISCAISVSASLKKMPRNADAAREEIVADALTDERIGKPKSSGKLIVGIPRFLEIRAPNNPPPLHYSSTPRETDRVIITFWAGAHTAMTRSRGKSIYGRVVLRIPLSLNYYKRWRDRSSQKTIHPFPPESIS